MNLTTADPATGLTTDRTIDRHLTHRAALAEVFLTDFVSVDDETFHAAAQLPPSHFYYGDHIARPALHDPLVVFESVRQMLLCAMHVQHGASDDTKAITATADLEITDARPLRADGSALDLTMLGRVALEKSRGDAVSRVVHQVEVLTRDGRDIGRVEVDTALRAGDAYQELRMSHRTSQPPLSSSGALLSPPPRVAVAPHLAGRENASNVVLGDAVSGGDTVAATLRTPASHTSMFDHPQDHLPGPVMMEAARQAALLLAGECLGLAPAKLYLRQMRASYLRFAELDAEISVQARLLPESGSGSGAVRRGCLAEVVFDQDGDTVARLEVQMGSILSAEHGAARAGHDG